MESNKSMYIKIGMAVFAIGFIYAMASFVVPKALVTMTKAAPAKIISLADSKIIGEKILARADGKDNCIVNVYILDKSGKGVPNKEVVLEGVTGIVPESVVTDNEGKAKFTVASTQEGTFKLVAVVGGSPLSKEIKVTFRK